MKTKMLICQSCGMPIEKDPKGGGTHKDGSRTTQYCSSCYKKGEFTFNGNLADFKDLFRGMLIQSGNSKITAWWFTRKLKNLERWKDKK